MRTFCLRWRWILVLTVVLFAAGGFLLRDLLTPDAQLAFDRVQPGMTIDEVDKVVATPFPPSISIGLDYVDMDYRCPEGTVSVYFLQGHVTDKHLYHYPKPTFWDELRAWLNRARAALGL
jgi:hypothetical protein